MTAPDDAVSRWRAEALAAEGPALEARGRAALAGAPSAPALRDLSLAAPLLALDAPARAAASALVRWGLAAERGEVARWDAVHAAAELGLTEVAGDVRALLAGGAGAPPGRADGASGPVRGRAAEAFAALAAPAEARARLEPVRQTDADWTVRRLAGDALRLLEARRSPERGDPLARFRALVRCGRARVEGGSQPMAAQQLAGLGLRLPAAYRLFLATACAGGRIVLAADDPKGAFKDAASLTLTPPLALRAELAAGGPRPDELRRIQEHVWARHVEGGKGGPGVDEDWALRLLGERYDRGLVDEDAWNYGVLLYEASFRDAARRARHLLRAAAVLGAYRELVAEAWDVVDDRLQDARDLVAQEGLVPPAPDPGSPRALLPLGRWEGVHPLAVDLERPGVLQVDPDRGAVLATLAGTLLELLNDPLAHAPGATPAAPLVAPVAAVGSSQPSRSRAAPPAEDGALAEALEHLAAGRHKQAGRAFADALEADPTPALLEAAAALLCRAELTPLLAAQLLASVLMAGDKKTSDLARDVLSALPPGRALAMLEAVAPHDEDGSQYALLTDAAGGLRKKSHADVREAAKRMKTSRKQAHVRTIKNPFYK